MENPFKKTNHLYYGEDNSNERKTFSLPIT